ncbi:MAG: hypothetical protein WDZ41_05105 [Candidatus Babeliales bacterium]
MAIVHFNPYPEDDVSIEELNQMKDAFFALSQEGRYKKADIAFIGVNLQKIPDLADDLANDFKMTTMSDFEATEEVKGELEESEEPTIVLFKDGKPLKKDGEIVKRIGYLSETEIAALLDNDFGSYINATTQRNRDLKFQRRRIRTLRPQRAVTRRVYRTSYSPASESYTYYPRYRSSYYARPYYGSYRPYYGGYYGGYGYPYSGGYYGRRWGRGSGLGFGIGFGGRRGGFGIGFGW